MKDDKENQSQPGQVELSGYMPDLDKDIDFLQEMKETFERIQNGNGWDKMQMDHLGTMIYDWLKELEQIKGI